jgi:tetratricopeptide (TPR) repeat protein
LTIDIEAEGWLRYLDLYRESLNRSDLEEVMEAMRKGDLTRAERHCKALIDENGGADATLWAVLGLYYLVKRDLDKARTAIDRAMEIAPDATLTMNVAGDYFTFANDFETAEQFYLHSLEQDPEQLHPRQVLANRYSVYERYEEAIEIIIPLLESHPEDEDVWMNLRVAVGCMPSKKLEKKLAHILLERFPNQYHAWCIMANSLMRRGRPEEAIEYCRRALAVRTNDSLAWTMYGTILSMQGKYKAALLCQKKAVQYSGDDTKALASLSIAYYLAGDVKQAMKIADRIIRIAPEEAIELVGYLEEWEQESKAKKKSRSRKRTKGKRE